LRFTLSSSSSDELESLDELLDEAEEEEEELEVEEQELVESLSLDDPDSTSCRLLRFIRDLLRFLFTWRFFLTTPDGLIIPATVDNPPLLPVP
jgi:hypothetical protein